VVDARDATRAIHSLQIEQRHGSLCLTRAGRMRRSSSAQKIRITFLRLWFYCFLVLLGLTFKERISQGTPAIPTASTNTYVPLRPCWSQQPNSIMKSHLDRSMFTKVQCRNSHAKKLTIAMIYYEDADYLRAHIESWLTLPANIVDQLSFLIVDDGSQFDPAQRVMKNFALIALTDMISLTLLRVQDDIPWNIGGARNLVASQITTRYFFLIDADILIPVQLFYSLLNMTHEAENHRIQSGIETVYTHFPRRMPSGGKYIHKPHPAIVLISAVAYWMAGGCDEDFVGHYGSTDPHFRWRLARTQGIRVLNVNATLSGIPFLHQVERENSFRLERNKTRNARLFVQKRSGAVPWSCTYIRFNWSLISEFCQ